MKEVIVTNQSYYRLKSGNLTLEQGLNRLSEDEWQSFQKLASGLAREYLNDGSIVAIEAHPLDLNSLTNEEARELIELCKDAVTLKRWYLNSHESRKYLRWLICERIAYVSDFEWLPGEFRQSERYWTPDQLGKDRESDWMEHNQRIYEQARAREVRARKIREYERKLDLGLV